MRSWNVGEIVALVAQLHVYGTASHTEVKGSDPGIRRVILDFLRIFVVSPTRKVDRLGYDQLLGKNKRGKLQI